jgi:hypothetical protein
MQRPGRLVKGGRAGIDEQDIHLAVIVVIEDRDSRARSLGQVVVS